MLAAGRDDAAGVDRDVRAIAGREVVPVAFRVPPTTICGGVVVVADNVTVSPRAKVIMPLSVSVWFAVS